MKTIFVFGSNLAGRHGKGAALFAKQKYGAIYGVGEGLSGNSYALPTKDENLKTRTLEEIKGSIKKFCLFAAQNNDMHFLLTPIVTGLAGYRKREIWGILSEVGIPENVYLTSSWLK